MRLVLTLTKPRNPESVPRAERAQLPVSLNSFRQRFQ